MSRRAQKKVSTFTSDSWSLTSSTTYLYDGWNLVKEQSTINNQPSTSFYIWGLDLSGSLQGAGGIGGLLARVKDNAVQQYTYDGNGNVSELLNSDGSIAAHYEYDPYGNAIAPIVSDNPFRFSTKYLDAETGLYYYGYRWYSTQLGRWISRDPLEEFGGINLYSFVSNSPTNNKDAFGLEGLEGSGSIMWTINRATLPVRIPLGLIGSFLTFDVFSEDSPIPSYSSDQCSFLITVTGMREHSDSQEGFMNQVAGLNMFKGVKNPAWVKNPTSLFGVADVVQILINETTYAITIPDLRMATKIEAAAHAAKRNGCACWCVTVVAHSQGTMIVKRALDLITPEMKKHISLIGLGGETTFGPGDGVNFTKNIAHVKDPVPKWLNKLSFWNGWDTVEPFGKEPEFAKLGPLDSHNWEKSYLPYLSDHSFETPCNKVQ